MEDCPWARAHSARSWQSHWHGNGVLQRRMHRVQQKGMQEQQDDEEESTASPAPTHTHLPLAGPSNPHAISLQNARLGKRKARDVEYIDSLPPRKRPHTGHTRSKPSVQSNDEHGQTGPAEPRPSDQELPRFFTRASAQSARTVARDLPPLCSPSKCSTPIPLHVLTSTPRPPVIPLLPPAIIRESPAKSNYNSNIQSGLPRPLATRSLRRWARNEAE